MEGHINNFSWLFTLNFWLRLEEDGCDVGEVDHLWFMKNS